MVARGPGDVGCAHCTKLGANQPCQVCTLLVCDACAADWTTCSEPVGRELRLGTSARVKDIDPNGRFAIVSHWRKAPRLFDLRVQRWAGHLPISHSFFAMLGAIPPRLTTTGMVAYAGIRVVSDEAPTLWGVRWRTLAGGIDELIDVESMQRCTVMSTTDQFAYVSTSEKVIVMTPRLGEMPRATNVMLPRAFSGPTFGVSTQTFDPMPRKVIHAMHLTNDILVSATWRELVVDRIVDDKLERLARLDTTHDGNIGWVSLAGNVLAYAVRGVVEVRRVDAAYNIGPVIARHRGDFTCGALSLDGQYLAFGMGDRVVLHDLERDEQTTYGGHTDKVSFVKFAADDHLLITADDDNRVQLRQRTPSGYVRTVSSLRVCTTE